jgi:TM2 domain-containing membrane protein YozV
MFCAGCGREMTTTEQFCQGCGRAAATSAGLAPTPGVAVAPAMQVQPQPQVIMVKNPKNPGVAAVLSFFWAGLGQIYNGEIGKGVIFLIGYLVSLMLIFVVIGFITTPILWIYGMVDAYKTAEKLNAAPPQIR